MRILGVETSCDETAICLIEATGEFDATFRFRVLGNALSSQAALHAAYGGVFPNLAKREHIKNLPLVFEEVFTQAGDVKADALAVTVGPGLAPCLWTGINFVQDLAAKTQLPVVAVDHMEGHIMLSMMHEDRLAPFEFPVLALLISGGHTELVVMHGPPADGWSYEVVGRTRDDAAGEAFDKVARSLGLSYPGGPEISRLAKAARDANAPRLFTLPRPMLHEDNLDFSFSGLKTAVLRLVESCQGDTLTLDFKEQVAREFEDAVADVLVEKTMRAVDAYGINTLVVGGGVSANFYIRERLKTALEEDGGIAKLLIPPPALSTDNALMIALAGYFRAQKGTFTDPGALTADGNLELS